MRQSPRFAGRIGRIDALRDDALDAHRAGFVVESRAFPDDMIAVMQAWCGVPEQRAEPLLALDQRPRPEIFAVEVEKIEQEEDERRRVAAVRSELNDVEGSDAVGTDAAEFAVEIGLAHIELDHGLGDRRVLVRPIEPGAGQQFRCAAIDPGVHAVAVVFDFVQPLVAVRRYFDQLGELRRNARRQTGRAAGYRLGHAGSRNGLPQELMRLLSSR